MRHFFAGLLGSAIVAGAVVCSPMTASALPLASGAASSLEVANPLIEKVVVRRRAPPRRIASVRRGRGGISPGAAALIGLGVAGVAAVIANDQRQQRERERRQQYYYQQQPYGYGQQPAYARQPVCGWQQQPTYDQYGNYRGDRAVQVCQ